MVFGRLAEAEVNIIICDIIRLLTVNIIDARRLCDDISLYGCSDNNLLTFQPEGIVVDAV